MTDQPKERMTEGKGLRVYTPKAAPAKLGHKETAAEIIAALMWGAKSRKELSNITGADVAAVSRWLKAFSDSGIVYVSCYSGGSAMFGLQSKPFGNADVDPPRPRAKHTVRGFRVPAPAIGVAP